MKKTFKKGISIVEVIVVIAVLAIIFAVVFSQFSAMRERQVLKSAIENIISSLNQARSATLSSLNSSSYGVYFSSGEVVIFPGTSFVAGAEGNLVKPLSEPARISSVALGGVTGNSGELFFQRLSGDPSKAGSITVSTPNLSKTITISVTGALIQINYDFN